MTAFHRLLSEVRVNYRSLAEHISVNVRGTCGAHETCKHDWLLQELHAAKTYPSSTGRQLLQYYDPYYDRGYNWSGGRIAGVIVGAVFFALAILFLIIAITLRRRRMASYQVGTSCRCIKWHVACTPCTFQPVGCL